MSDNYGVEGVGDTGIISILTKVMSYFIEVRFSCIFLFLGRTAEWGDATQPRQL